MADLAASGFHHDDEILIGNSRAEQIAVIAVCLAHDAEDCVEYLVAPMHDSRMTAHKGRIITGRKP